MTHRLFRWPALVVMGGAIAFAVLVVALHFLRPDVDPLSGDLSNYAVGPYGYLMAAAFVALGLSLFSTGTVLLHGQSGNRRLEVGRRLLAISGIAVALVAAFPSAAESPETAGDYVEVIASVISFVGFGIGAGLISVSAWTGPRRMITIFLSGAFGLCLLVMMFGPDAIHGLLMRAAAGCIMAWLMVGAIWLPASAGPTRPVSTGG